MTPPRCDACHRPLKTPSPDRLGPKCRRKQHPATTTPRHAAHQAQPIHGQADLLELLETDMDEQLTFSPRAKMATPPHPTRTENGD